MRPPSLSEIYGMLGPETHQFCPIRTPSSDEPFVVSFILANGDNVSPIRSKFIFYIFFNRISIKWSSTIWSFFKSRESLRWRRSV